MQTRDIQRKRVRLTFIGLLVLITLAVLAGTGPPTSSERRATVTYVLDNKMGKFIAMLLQADSFGSRVTIITLQLVTFPGKSS